MIKSTLILILVNAGKFSDVLLRGVDSFFKESESAETRPIGVNPPNRAGTRQNFDEVRGKPLIFWKKTIQVSIKEIAICPKNVESVAFFVTLVVTFT